MAARSGRPGPRPQSGTAPLDMAEIRSASSCPSFLEKLSCPHRIPPVQTVDYLRVYKVVSTDFQEICNVAGIVLAGVKHVLSR